MVQLVFKSGPHNGSAIRLGPGLNRIGRNPANDILIPDPSISSFHCEMHVSDLGVAFRDVGSRNGSYIEGRRVTKEILSAGKTLRLGGVEFDLYVPTANIAIPQRQQQEQAPANFLADGTQACQTHADERAGFHCVKCEKVWCPECVRRTALVGSANATYSCTECGGKCQAIVAAAPKKKSLFNSIQESLRRFRN
jgi:hypothetical protein